MDNAPWVARLVEELRFHWGTAYVIDASTGNWRAERRDGKGVLRAGSAAELLGMIRADYGAVPVPR